MSDLYIGLMSGTSMDGVDAVLVNLADNQPQLLARYCANMPIALHDDLLALCEPGYDEINRLGQADRQLGAWFADAVQCLLEQARVTANDICAIGSHGQTIRHQPQLANPFTLQIGDANTIAELTGITTVADFRRRNMVVGGQGAPLTPLFHEHVFRTNIEDRVVLNIGGMSNITLLPRDPQKPLGGFDTGPGNVLLDAWIQQHANKLYDDQGAWAATGTVNENLLNIMLLDLFFQQAPPKSTGRELFNLAWLKKQIGKLQIKLSPVDIQATLVELTACSIQNAIQQYGPIAATILICGGGVHNKYLQQRLAQQLPQYKLMSTDDFGVDADCLEAMAFAWLAKQTLQQQKLNAGSFTGATRATILGAIYY